MTHFEKLRITNYHAYFTELCSCFVCRCCNNSFSLFSSSSVAYMSKYSRNFNFKSSTSEILVLAEIGIISSNTRVLEGRISGEHFNTAPKK